MRWARTAKFFGRLFGKSPREFSLSNPYSEDYRNPERAAAVIWTLGRIRPGTPPQKPTVSRFLLVVDSAARPASFGLSGPFGGHAFHVHGNRIGRFCWADPARSRSDRHSERREAMAAEASALAVDSPPGRSEPGEGRPGGAKGGTASPRPSGRESYPYTIRTFIGSEPSRRTLPRRSAPHGREARPDAAEWHPYRRL